MVQLLYRDRQPIGLDIGSRILKAAQLRASRKAGFKLVRLGFEELPPDCIVNGEIISKFPVSEAIGRIFSEQDIQTRQASTSISGHSVIVKKISLPVQCRENLAESIRWEAEQHIPFAISEVNLNFQVLKLNAKTGTIEVLLVAGKKDKINDYAGVVKMAGKTPVLVDADAFALQNAYVFNYEPADKSIVALLDIGASIMTINIAAGADILYTRDVTIAQNASRPAAEILCHELKKTCDFLKSTQTADHIDHIIGSGGAVHAPGLIETLARKFSAPAEKFDSFKKIACDTNQFSPSLIADRAPDFAIAIGLALRTARPGFLPGFRVNAGKKGRIPDSQ
jgi:type IV pilus assembly protein PilM